ncbi:hypothetical protein MauCBS54593_007063 [Microsporum audouinii]
MNQAEFETHRLAHQRIQSDLRRRPYTYGARTVYPRRAPIVNPNSPGLVLPVTSNDTLDSTNQPTLPVAGPSGVCLNPVDSTKPNISSQLMGRVDGNSELYDILSNFMTQDKSFLFFRNFSRLNIKNLLWMQDGLIELEKELIQAKSTDNAQHEGSQDDIIRLRKLIAENIALVQLSQLSELKKPKLVSQLRRWIEDIARIGHPGLRLLDGIDTPESDHVLIARSEEPRTGMYKFIEGLTWRLFSTPAAGGRKVWLPKGGSLYIFDNSMVRRAFRAAVTMLIWKVVYHSNVFEYGYHA